MAKGIDSYSHIGCIKAGGKTIAVLGSGLDIIYPKENCLLYDEILSAKGLILSEYVWPPIPPLAELTVSVNVACRFFSTNELIKQGASCVTGVEDILK